jgi:hypothetical protein
MYIPTQQNLQKIMDVNRLWKPGAAAITVLIGVP